MICSAVLISRKIDSFKFSIEFKACSYLNGEVFESLKANFLFLSPHEKSKEFSNFIMEIMDFCYFYSEVFESYVPKEEMDSYDLEFRNSMEKIYLKIQKFYILSSALKPVHFGMSFS